MGKRKDWEIWQDGMRVATSTDAADALHYAMIYSQDGPVTIKPPTGVVLAEELAKIGEIAK